MLRLTVITSRCYLRMRSASNWDDRLLIARYWRSRHIWANRSNWCLQQFSPITAASSSQLIHETSTLVPQYPNNYSQCSRRPVISNQGTSTSMESRNIDQSVLNFNNNTHISIPRTRILHPWVVTSEWVKYQTRHKKQKLLPTHTLRQPEAKLK